MAATKMIKSPVNGFAVEAFNDQFAGKDMVSIKQFTAASEVAKVFSVARQMERIVKSKKTASILRDITMAELFYQPSTRTFTSFLAAARWLGCQRTIAIHGMEAYSSVTKGESLPDTIMSIEQTTAADIIVMRHPEDNSAYEAAHFSSVPIVNGGSGKLEHPTQAILDLYTIHRRLGTTKGLKVGMLGDLLNGRTVKSLAKILTLVDPKAKLYFISPKVLELPREEVADLKKRGAQITETDSLRSVLPELDVLYVTRIQKEWFKTPAQQKLYAKLKGQYDINNKWLKLSKKKMIVMHPLPRVGEIAYEVDDDPRSAYFEEMRMGLYTRMALLGLLTGKIK
jgi:aspartate carbamoyltransferase